MKLDQSTWTRIPFVDMADHLTERVDDPRQAGVDRYVGLEHLTPGELTVSRWGKPGDVGATKLRVRPGDLIFAKRRAYQRKLGVVDFDGICSAHAMVLRARPNVMDQKFLPVFMHGDDFMDRAKSISVGSLSPTINWKTLAAQEFLIPPLSEQRLIAELLWAAEDVATKNGMARTYARAAEIAVLREAYDVATWPVRKVSEAGEVQLGLMRSPKVHAGADPRPYLRVANVGDDELFLDDVMSMNFDEQNFRKYQLRSGDVLLNEGQSLELVGRCAIYREEIPGCCFQKTLLRFRSGSDILPEFAYGWFRRCFHLGEFSRVASRTTSMAHLTARIFSNLPIPVPSLAVQRSVIERVEAARTVRRRLADHERTSRQLRPHLLNYLLAERP